MTIIALRNILHVITCKMQLDQHNIFTFFNMWPFSKRMKYNIHEFFKNTPKLKAQTYFQ